MSYYTDALPWARQASAQTGVLTSVILAQWDVEGQGWPPAFNNPGDVGDPNNAGQTSYASIQAGVDAYVETMMLSYYSGVRSAVGYVAQSQALGRSPWAASHYGNPPGSDLISIIQTYSLTQYDGATPVPPPAPLPPLPDAKEESMQLIEASDGKLYVAAASAGTGNAPEDNLLLFQLTLNPGAAPKINTVTDVTAGIQAIAGGATYRVQP
jgi:hypothetical protein